VMDVFSFVDLFFIVDPPHKADGACVLYEHVDFDLFSFVQGSGVEVFVRSSLLGLFLVDSHDLVTWVVMFDVGGVRRRIGSVYVPPKAGKSEWLAAEATWDDCQFLMGDFNGKNISWNVTWKAGTVNISDCDGMWLSQFCDRKGVLIHPPARPTLRNISAIDLFICASRTRVAYDGTAGLEHPAVIARLKADEPVDMVR